MSTTPTDPPLGGLDVLLTRDSERAADTIERLRALGARVDARAAIVFEPPRDSEPARVASTRVRDYRWLVFTSPNGVRFFVERLRSCGAEIPARRAGVVAIGRGTARALEEVDLAPEVVATEADSAGLARALLSRVGASERVLVIRPEIAGDRVPAALRDAGAEVDAVAFYRTVASPDAEAIARRVAEREYDVIVFSSPSNLKFMLRAGGAAGIAIERGLETTRRVAIGKTTAAALGKEGLAAHAVARTPDTEGIVEAVVRSVS